MANYRKILFPVELSGVSAGILPHVKAVTEAFDAELHMVYVAKPNEFYTEEDSQPGQTITEAVQRYRQTHCRMLGDVKVVVLDGEPEMELLTYIDSEGIDMVVMASRGKTALGKAVFGSVAGGVVRGAKVPVLIAQPPRE